MGVEVGIHICGGGSLGGDVEVVEVEGEMVVAADMVGVEGVEVSEYLILSCPRCLLVIDTGF